MGQIFVDLPSGGALVDNILRREAADLPGEPALPSSNLTLNLKTAKALGITVPQSVLRRADEVIE